MYLFFYGHSSTNPHGYLSNWYAHPFKKDDVLYLTSEHYMMYWKAKLMKDDEVANKVLLAKGPKEAKALGRKVSPWNEKIMDRTQRSYNV